MTNDLSAAIAAAREALERYYESEDYGVSPIALRDLLAAIDAAQGEAVAWKITLADNTGTYDYAQWAGLQAPQAPPAAVPAAVKQVIDEMIDVAPTCEKDWDDQLRLWASMLAAAKGETP